MYNAQTVMSKNMLMEDALPDNFLLLLLSNEDLIFGISDKLRNLLNDTCSSHQPEVLFVVTTCLLEIIGEDLDIIVDEISKESGIPVVAIHTENFTSDSPETGLQNMMTSLFDLMEGQAIIPKTVNIWGMQRNQLKQNELVFLLKKKGIKINTIFPGKCNLDELRIASSSALNLVMRPFAQELARKMKEAYGIPYVNCEMTYTPEETIKTYQKIATLLEIDFLDEIQKEKMKFEKRMGAVKKQVNKKSCAVNLSFGAQSSRVFNFIEFLRRLKIEVKVLFLREIRPEDWEDIKRLKSQDLDFPIFRSDDVMPSEMILNDLKADYYIGYSDKEDKVRNGIELKNPITAFRTNGFSTGMQLLKILERKAPELEILEFRENIRNWGSEA